MQRSKKEKVLYFIAKFLGVWAFLGLIIAAIINIYSGQGLSYNPYKDGLNSYLGNLILLAIVAIILMIGWSMRRYSRKHSRSGK